MLWVWVELYRWQVAWSWANYLTSEDRITLNFRTREQNFLFLHIKSLTHYMCNSGKVNLSKPQVSHLYDGDEKYLPYRFVVRVKYVQQLDSWHSMNLVYFDFPDTYFTLTCLKIPNHHGFDLLSICKTIFSTSTAIILVQITVPILIELLQ